MTVRIRPVGQGRQARPFIDAAVACLRRRPGLDAAACASSCPGQLDPKHNPFLRYGKAQLFVVERDGEVVGRISAHTNPAHDARHGERAGFFGFFECIDDDACARALIESAEDWLAGESVDFVRGPVSFTINQEMGTLVEGFDTPPMVAMPHGRPYYDALLRGAGYAKGQGPLRLEVPGARAGPPHGARARPRASAEIDGLAVRELDKKHLRRDIGIGIDIFNDAWRDNWGFVPVREDEVDQLATRSGAVPPTPPSRRWCPVHDQPVAMVFAIPNLNEVARDIDGRLLPLRLDQGQVAAVARPPHRAA